MVFKGMLIFFSEFLLYYLADIALFRKIAKFLNKTFSPKKDILVIVKGKKMYANTLDRLIALYLWKFSLLENFETKLMKKITKKGDIIFDIGANIGYYPLILVDLIGNKGKVYAFEPDPNNYRLLLKNIKANNHKNIIPVQKAISDKIGHTTLFICEEHTGDHRIYDLGDGRKAIKVETTTLDKFVGNKIKPNLIKIDIQGAEFLAFSGMENTIKRNKDMIIICEFSPAALKKCGHSPTQFIDKLRGYGFKLKFIDESKETVKSITPSSLIKMCSGNKYTNLYLER